MTFRLFAALGLSIMAATGVSHADIKWESSYGLARTKARDTGKPLFINFYTEWCPWCKKMDTDIYSNPEVQQLSRSFIMFKANVYEPTAGASLAKSFDVRAYPTNIFASSTGQQVARTSFPPPADFIKMMKQALALNAWEQSNKTALQKTAKPSISVPAGSRMTLDSGQNYWKKQPELREAISRSNYGGTLLLGDGGIVQIDRPAAKPKKPTSKSKTTTKNKSKRRN